MTISCDICTNRAECMVNGYCVFAESSLPKTAAQPFTDSLPQSFDCHYDGDIERCDKDCKQIGACKRRTSVAHPTESATPRTDACQGSDGTIPECDELAELCRTLEHELESAYIAHGKLIVEGYAKECETADLRRELGPWRIISGDSNDDTWCCIECKSTVSKGLGHYPSPYGHTRECSHGVGPTIDQAEEAERQRDAMQEQYNELIMAVAKKHPNETRHQTALRYIQQRERASMQFEAGKSALPKGDGK